MLFHSIVMVLFTRDFFILFYFDLFLTKYLPKWTPWTSWPVCRLVGAETLLTSMGCGPVQPVDWLPKTLSTNESFETKPRGGRNRKCDRRNEMLNV